MSLALFSPFANLRRNIAATMAGLSLTHDDEAAFQTWLYSAWCDSGFVPDFAVLSQPASSTTIRFDVRVGVAGRKVNVWWGDASSNSYAAETGMDTACLKTYATASLRPVIVVGSVTEFQSTYSDGRSDFGGSVAGLTSLKYLAVFGNNTLSGSVAGLTLLTGIYVGGNNTLSGSVAGLTLLNYIAAFGNNTLSGWGDLAASATGLCALYQGGVTVLDSSEVNAVLAGFWTNRDAAKPRGDRVIDLGKDTPTPNGAPTGQGITDKAALQAYKSPGNTGPSVWGVVTN